MKKTKISVMAVSVICPHCSEPITNATGSQMWTMDDVARLETVNCFSCGKESKIPNVAGPLRLEPQTLT